MNPYLTIDVYLPANAEYGTEEKMVKGKILPSQVFAYTEGSAWGTILYLSTGQAFMIKEDLKTYEEMVRQYWREIAKSQIKQSKTIVLPGTGRN